MGDRTWFQISCHTKDKEAVEAELKWWEEYWNNDSSDKHDYHCHDVNYGNFDEVENLANKGLTFQGSHGNGDGYGPYAFVCFMGELVWQQTDHDNNITVIISKQGPDPQNLAEAMHFFEIEDLVNKFFDNDQSPEFIAEITRRKLKKS